MITQYNLKLPKAVYSGEGALNSITTILTQAKAKKVAVFTDKGIRGAGLLDLPLELIQASGAENFILDDLPTEPTCDEAQSVIDRFKTEKPDFIIAVGGGSVMDIAKLASILVTDQYGVRDLLNNPALGKKCISTLMIPTTAGTGSEATPNSIVLVPEKELKVGIVNADMIADNVILDGAMIKKLPRKIAASTGVDALAHAIECFTSKKANPFSDIFALEALNIIFNNIEEACDNPDALQAKTNMLIAAFYAGIAITASGTTAVHALSYPLGGKYHIAHGTSNAMLLVPVMKFNESVCKERLAAVYERVVTGEKTAVTTEEKSAWVIYRLDEIVKHLGIPTSLKEYGVGFEDVDDLVKAGMNVQRLLVNNMREVTAQDAKELYLGLLQ
jgi:alcohol dehydrogenase class IV